MATRRDTTSEVNAVGNGLSPPAAPEFDLSKYAYQPPVGGATRRTQLTIPTGRPRDSFFWLDPRPAMQQIVALFKYRPEGELTATEFILAPPVAEHLGTRAIAAVIRVLIVRPAIIRLWAIALPDGDRRPNGYTDSIWDAIPALESGWGRLDVNESRTGYDLIQPLVQWPEPEWRDDSLAQLIERGYRGKIIDDLDHPVMKAYFGTV
jgi:hypothetical protein